MWIIAGIVAVVLTGLALTPLIIRAISKQGGTSDADAASIASQTLAWSDAYRGASKREYPAMDGSIELAPPTQDGGGA